MVINFNLLLVWLPMCKYSLTRLAYLGNIKLKGYKKIHHQLGGYNDHCDKDLFMVSYSLDQKENFTQKLARKFKTSLQEAILKFKIGFIEIKINSINSFLIAVDHCKQLHTICATTITAASGEYN